MRRYIRLYFGTWAAALVLAAVLFVLFGWVTALVAIGLSSFVRYFAFFVWRRTGWYKRSAEQVCSADERSLRLASRARVVLAIYGFLLLEGIAVSAFVFGTPRWVGVAFAVWGPVAGWLILRTGHRLRREAGAQG